MDKKYLISSESELEAVIGEPMEFVKMKIASRLDEVMKEFIRRSPLVFISTIDVNGHVDISPRGDPNGFVQVDDSGNEYRKHKRPVCPGPAAVYRQRPATSPSVHIEYAPNSAYFV